MDFRNRVEMLLVVVTQFFERNDISFTDMEGALIDMTTIRSELEGAYNYLRELIDAQAVEIRAVSRLTVARIDALERELEAERSASAAAQREAGRDGRGRPCGRDGPGRCARGPRAAGGGGPRAGDRAAE